MSIQSNNHVAWSDIMNLFDRALSEQNRFGLTPSEDLKVDRTNQKIVTGTVTDLLDIIDSLSAHENVGAAADISAITPPNQGELITTTPFT